MKLNPYRAAVAGIKRDFENTSAIPFGIRARAVKDCVAEGKGHAAAQIVLQGLQGMRSAAADEIYTCLEELSGDLTLP